MRRVVCFGSLLEVCPCCLCRSCRRTAGRIRSNRCICADCGIRGRRSDLVATAVLVAVLVDTAVLEGTVVLVGIVVLVALGPGVGVVNGTAFTAASASTRP